MPDYEALNDGLRAETHSNTDPIQHVLPCKIHNYGACENDKNHAGIDDDSNTSAKVNVSAPPPTEEQQSVEQIFVRADEGKEHYDALGGLEGVANVLRTDLQRGVSAETVKQRRELYGANVLPEDPPLTFWQIYRATWKDKMIQLLSAAACVSLVLGLTVPEPGHAEVNYKSGWVDGFAILCSVVVVTLASAINDWRKELKFYALTLANALQPVYVWRDGALAEVDVTEIVVGDLVHLTPGLVMPVDGLYVRGMSVVIDESSVTGENDPKKKNESSPIILSGTIVSTAEDAYALACAVGERSFGGKLLMESQHGNTPRPTPLQERLNDLAELIGRFGLIASVSLFAVLSAIEGISIARKDRVFSAQRFIDYFLLCVVLVCVSVPEGLPLAVTIALANSQNKMHDDNNQVRRLRACETMGNVTQICSDKTGTLTQNMMSVVQGYIGMVYFKVARPGDVSEPIDLGESAKSELTQLLTKAIAVCSSSEKVRHDGAASMESGDDSTAVWQWMSGKGNKTDNALLDFVDRVQRTGATSSSSTAATLPHQELRARSRERAFTLFPFTSDRKRMSAVVQNEDGSMTHFIKGGSDRILPLCDRYVNEAGEEVELNEADREQIMAQVNQLARAANRTIGVAYTRLSDDAIPEVEPHEPFVWLSLIGIQDPLRPEVQTAVRKCQMAGVVVRMCTGDNLETAVAIARECGIFSHLRGDMAMTGRDFRDLVYDAYGSDERMVKFWPVLDRMVVMARSQPLDKQLLVLMMMSRGEIVAVTGDGTNDAPALRLADVGLVMHSGTDIAIKSSDIVLLDDNFRSVQRAVVWGRCVNDNIRKFLQLQLTVNYTSVVLTCVGSVLARGASSPLTTVQLLWVNLIMDTLAALALATEEPTDECLKRGPVNRAAPLISHRMYVTVFCVGMTQLGLLFLVLNLTSTLYSADAEYGQRLRSTFAFNVFVLSTLFHFFNCRKLFAEVNVFEGLWSRSRSLIFVFAGCVVFQVIAVELMNEFMNTTPLPWVFWCLSLCVGVVSIVVGVLSRFICVFEPRFQRFNPEHVDNDVKHLLSRLSADVDQRSELDGPSSGVVLNEARHARMRFLWHSVYVRHVKTRWIVDAFRRACSEYHMHSSDSRNTYSRMQLLSIGKFV